MTRQFYVERCVLKYVDNDAVINDFNEDVWKKLLLLFSFLKFENIPPNTGFIFVNHLKKTDC